MTLEMDDFAKHVAYSATNLVKSSFSDVTKLRNTGLQIVRNQGD